MGYPRSNYKGEPCEDVLVTDVGIKKRCGKYCEKHPEVEKSLWSINKRVPQYGNFLCPACMRERKWREHGIADLTWEAFQRLPQKCAICGSTDRLVPDHDHKTGAVRGILCNTCNRVLGFAGDDIKRLRNAIVYLGGEPCTNL